MSTIFKSILLSICFASLIGCVSTKPDPVPVSQINKLEDNLLNAIAEHGIISEEYNESFKAFFNAVATLEDSNYAFARQDQALENIYQYHLMEFGPEHELTTRTESFWKKIQWAHKFAKRAEKHDKTLFTNSEPSEDELYLIELSRKSFNLNLEAYRKQEKPFMHTGDFGNGTQYSYDVGYNETFSSGKALMDLYKRIGDEEKIREVSSELMAVLKEKKGEQDKGVLLLATLIEDLDERSGYIKNSANGLSLSQNSLDKIVDSFKEEAEELVF
ncbi:hypothetical protein [Thalassotalea litorea]|uniref:hypothetical protein n=1 Tax=Thalassotalea litorea TaxID=2020715 RepID=UPI0037368116